MEVANARAMNVKSSKKRKLNSQDQIVLRSSSSTSSNDLSTKRCPIIVEENAVSSSNSDQISTPLDSKVENFGTTSRSISNGCYSRGKRRCSEIWSEDFEVMESSKTKKKKKKASPAAVVSGGAKTPSPEEIEEFFSVAEKYEQNRFKNKYNYDIVKDVPLEGRYQWIHIKP